MTLKSLVLTNFTAFDEAKFEFSPGLNILIGANSTGKTHVMKSIYTALKTCEMIQQDHFSLQDKARINTEFQEKLIRVFKPDSIGRLVRRAPGRGSGSLQIQFGQAKLKIEITTQNRISVTGDLPTPPPSIYLPSREFLSINEGFIASYLKRETPFDETYYDRTYARRLD